MIKRKCKYCKKGHVVSKDGIHQKCRPYWDAEHIPKKQKKKGSQCPICHESFDYWQLASKHAHKKKHFGDYTI